MGVAAIVSITVEKSCHTPFEWFVRAGRYCGEVMYYPVSMRWHARPRRGVFQAPSAWFDDMQAAIEYVATA